MSLSIVFTARATSIGGRNGHARSDDGLVSIDLTIPKAFGGPGREGATTPEHLFAAGYAACFGSAIEHIAAQKKLKLESIQVDSAVGMGPDGRGGFGFAVTLTAKIAGVSGEAARELVQAAHSICPYSNAIRGNVDVNLEVG